MSDMSLLPVGSGMGSDALAAAGGAFTRLGAVTRWCWSLKAFFMGVNGCLIG